MSKKAYGLEPNPEASLSKSGKIKFYGILFAILAAVLFMISFFYSGDEAIYFSIFIIVLVIIVVAINSIGTMLVGKYFFEIDGDVISKYNKKKLVGQNNIKSSTFELQTVEVDNNVFDYYLIVTEGTKEPVRYSSVMIGRQAFAEFMTDLNAVTGETIQ